MISQSHMKTIHMHWLFAKLQKIPIYLSFGVEFSLTNFRRQLKHLQLSIFGQVRHNEVRMFPQDHTPFSCHKYLSIKIWQTEQSF